MINSMSVDQLWSLHGYVTSPLARKITEQKAKLEERLRWLGDSILKTQLA
jgi:hypothetical protein